MFGASSALAAAETPREGAVAESPSEPTQGERGLMPSLLGATPEEQSRLTEERKRLSTIAAANGTDPTAIVGFRQLAYGRTTFTNNLRLDTATAIASNYPLPQTWVSGRHYPMCGLI